MGRYYCPLYEKEIEQGLCFDINLELEGIMKKDTIIPNELKEKRTVEEIKNTCMNCINYPF